MKKILLCLVILSSFSVLAGKTQLNEIKIHGTITLGYNVFIQYRYTAQESFRNCMHKEYRDHVYYPFTSIPMGDKHFNSEFTDIRKISIDENGAYSLSPDLFLSIVPSGQENCNYVLRKILLYVVPVNSNKYYRGKEYGLYVNSFEDKTGDEQRNIDVICNKGEFKIVCEYEDNRAFEIEPGETRLDIVVQ